MTQASTRLPRYSDIPCPGSGCKGRMIGQADGTFDCTTCGMTAHGEIFSPIAPNIHFPELAINEDATCVYHPQKKAVTVCQGTGNFICALCAVEIRGKTYSVQYLESKAGKKAADDIISRYLPRPDRVINNIFVAWFIPYVDLGIILIFPFWAAYGYFQCHKMVKMRRENALYHDLVGHGRIMVSAILLSAVLIIWLAVLVAIIFFGRFHAEVTVFHGGTVH